MAWRLDSCATVLANHISSHMLELEQLAGGAGRADGASAVDSLRWRKCAHSVSGSYPRHTAGPRQPQNCPPALPLARPTAAAFESPPSSRTKKFLFLTQFRTRHPIPPAALLQALRLHGVTIYSASLTFTSSLQIFRRQLTRLDPSYSSLSRSALRKQTTGYSLHPSLLGTSFSFNTTPRHIQFLLACITSLYHVVIRRRRWRL